MSNILPAIYLSIGFWCLALAWRGFKGQSLIFKKGTKGTGLENNRFLIKVQIAGTLILGVAMLGIGLCYAY